ncbi:hypothetical protein [Calothrix rhizosoleniae]|uniref:hypothetical protein n=1 Tax=Calothrix rhizosoleniae TaxID=888997 RepID=UPI0030DAA8F0
MLFFFGQVTKRSLTHIGVDFLQCGDEVGLEENGSNLCIFLNGQEWSHPLLV